MFLSHEMTIAKCVYHFESDAELVDVLLKLLKNSSTIVRVEWASLARYLDCPGVKAPVSKLGVDLSEELL